MNRTVGTRFDTVNPGCLLDPPLFSPIACGQIVCGTSRRQGSSYDRDYYELDLDVPATVSWTVRAEFPVYTHVADGTLGCGGSYVIESGTADTPCEAAQIAADLPPGTYWFRVSSTAAAGDLECGGRYQGELSCVPPIPGACCLGDLPCRDDLSQFGCEWYGGVFYPWQLCEQVTCCLTPPTPDLEYEGEPICYDGYLDTYNGGCQPPDYDLYYQWIDCGEVVVGHCGTYVDPSGQPRRDFDHYRLSYASEPWPAARYVWRVTPTFPAEIGFVEGGAWGEPTCPHYQTTATAGACQTAELDVSADYAWDVYWAIYVRPQEGATVPCGAPYVAELTCQTIETGCSYQRRGDANCDNAVNVFDIDAFVIALAQGQAAWEAAYGGPLPWRPYYDCGYTCLNDCNADGAVNVFDIDPFVELLIGGG